MKRHDPVLISGCSSGIGAATAAALVRDGHTVYATARQTETLDDLEALGCHPLAMDVTSETSMIAAVKTVEAGAWTCWHPDQQRRVWRVRTDRGG